MGKFDFFKIEVLWPASVAAITIIANIVVRALQPASLASPSHKETKKKGWLNDSSTEKVRLCTTLVVSKQTVASAQRKGIKRKKKLGLRFDLGLVFNPNRFSPKLVNS